MSVLDIPGASHRIEEKVLKRCRVSSTGKTDGDFWETFKRRVESSLIDGFFAYGALEWIDS